MSLQFTLSNDHYIRLLDQDIITAYPFTFACRIKPTGAKTAATTPVMTIASASNNVWGMYIYDGNPVLWANDGSTSSEVEGADPTYDVWNDFVLVFASATDRRMYLNGALHVSSTVSVNFTTITPNTLALGRNSKMGFTSFGMHASDFGLWSAELTTDEITAYSNGIGPNQLQRDKLKIYWRLEDPFIGGAVDLSGNNKTGTVSTGVTRTDNAPIGPYLLSRSGLWIASDTGVSGTGSGVFSAFTGSADGNIVGHIGTGSGVFPSLTGSASAILQAEGAGEGTFPALTGTANGSVGVKGDGIGTFPSFTGAAEGATADVVGIGAGTFSPLTGSANAILQAEGGGAGTFPAFTGSAEGILSIPGTGSGTFPAVTGSSTGIFTPNITGSGAGIFPSLTGSGAGDIISYIGTAAGTFPALTGSASAIFTPSAIGSGAGIFPSLTGSSQGIVINAIGSGSGIFLPFTGFSSGVFFIPAEGAGSGTFPALTGQSSGLIDAIDTFIPEIVLI